MKRIERFSSLGILLVFVVLTGCNSVPPASVPTQTDLQESSPMVILVPTGSATPTNTFMPASSPTATAILALSVTEANSSVQEFLQNGPNCPLPCWMGIIPGQSTWHELEYQQSTLSKITTDAYKNLQTGDLLLGGFDIKFTDSAATIRIYSFFAGAANGEKITISSFDTQAYKPYDDPDRDLYGYGPYNDMLRAYSLPEILSNLGTPTGIYVLASLRHDLPVTPGFGDYFLLHVIYQEKGILMEYQMKPDGVGNKYRICPADAWISGAFTPPNLGLEFGKLLASINHKFTYLADPSQQHGETSEEAFGMTMEAFYQTFLSTPGQCLETPKSLW
jgi:hypothetical protein